MPRLSTELTGGGDLSWLGSAHGISNARTEVLDVSAFTKATHYPDGYIKSGTPVAKVGGVLVPYDPTVSVVTGAGVLAGFILTDQKVVGDKDFGVSVLDHGRVRVAKVPGGFVTPIADKSATTIVFI